MHIKIAEQLKAQTVKHILALLLKRIFTFDVTRILAEGLDFKVEVPWVDNKKTEDLTSEQLLNLLKEIENSADIQAANIKALKDVVK